MLACFDGMLARIFKVHFARGSNQWGAFLVQVIFDLMDPQMVFETSEARNGQFTFRHAAAIVLTPGGKEGAPDGGEGTVNATLSLTRFNISNDKYYTNKKTHQQQKSNAKKRAIHGVKVMHSLPAIKLQSMKPKLSKCVLFFISSYMLLSCSSMCL